MKFEDLDGWQKSRQLVREVYALTKSKPLDRDFGLGNQIQRAAVSIMSNVAEGFERESIAEKVQFYRIARASAGEVRSLLYVIEDSYPTITSEAQDLRRDANTVGSIISGLIRSTKARL